MCLSNFARKGRREMIYCVGRDVKPYSLTRSVFSTCTVFQVILYIFYYFWLAYATPQSWLWHCFPGFSVSLFFVM